MTALNRKHVNTTLLIGLVVLFLGTFQDVSFGAAAAGTGDDKGPATFEIGKTDFVLNGQRFAIRRDPLCTHPERILAAPPADVQGDGP